jgi:hypothetical protein
MKKMSLQTKFETKFVNKVIAFCLANPGMTPHMICHSFGYNNSVKINDFINGNGSISSRTMGNMIEFMNKNKPKISKFQERFDEMKLKRTMPFKNE